MQKESKVDSENFSEEQKRTLIALLNLLIPPSEDGKMPGVADVGFIDYVHNENLFPWIREGLLSILEESYKNYNLEFSAMIVSKQTQLIDALRDNLFQFFKELNEHVIYCYYQHDDVMKAIGLEVRTPFPQGYVLEERNFDLLEPVYLRGKLYLD